jgi:STE24 endopeptidase
VAKVLPLVPLILWLAWLDSVSSPNAAQVGPASVVILVIGTLAIVGLMIGWSRLVVRTANLGHYRRVNQFQKSLGMARLLIVAWFAYCVYAMGFGYYVLQLLEPIFPLHLKLPSTALAIIVPMAGIVGLSVASFPIDRLTREHNLLSNLDDGLPVHAAPGLGAYVLGQLRLSVLFFVVPVLSILLFGDVAHLILRWLDVPLNEMARLAIYGMSLLCMFLFAPVLLKWVLRARPLPMSPLRVRLESLAKQAGVAGTYKDILLWPTGYSMGNAAVMGIVPRFRYVMLSDLLVETLSERQIEAVFAHEAGHIRHRHMWWYILFFAVFFLVLFGPFTTLFKMFESQLQSAQELDVILQVGVFLFFLVVYSLLCRLFEKQADVYAARVMELTSLTTPVNLSPMQIAVGPHGANDFVSALTRVAEINHMPVYASGPRRRGLLAAPIQFLVDVARDFQHPSTADRIHHVMDISLDSRSTAHFDRRVVVVMLGLLTLATLMAAWAGLNFSRYGLPETSAPERAQDVPAVYQVPS